MGPLPIGGYTAPPELEIGELGRVWPCLCCSAGSPALGPEDGRKCDGSRSLVTSESRTPRPLLPVRQTGRSSNLSRVSQEVSISSSVHHIHSNTRLARHQVYLILSSLQPVAYSLTFVFHPSFPPPLAFGLSSYFSFIILHSPFRNYLSPALRRAVRMRSRTAGSVSLIRFLAHSRVYWGLIWRTLAASARAFSS